MFVLVQSSTRMLTRALSSLYLDQVPDSVSDTTLHHENNE